MHGSIEIPKRDQVIARDLSKPAMVGLGVGIVGLLVTAVLGTTYDDGMRHFGHSMLLAIMFSLSISLGALFFTLIHHLTSAGWSVVVRRVAEAMFGALPWLGLLALVFLGLPTLLGGEAYGSYIYDWANKDFVDSHELIKGKAGYFAPTFFIARLIGYFAVWIFVGKYFSSNSLAQDDDQDPMRTLRMQRRAGVCLILFALSVTFASFDFVMSLNAEWFSTMYGVYFFAGCGTAGYSVLALSTMWLEKRGQLKGSVTAEHYHDIGKFMFAFTVFWSYVAFSQFMLYWYADIPEETHWFHYRMWDVAADGKTYTWGGWTAWSLALLVGHFAIPTLGLISRHAKRRRGILAFWAVYLLVFHFIDLYWNIMPELVNGVPGGDPAKVGAAFGPIDITAWVGVLGVFLFGFLKTLDGKPVLAIGDPRLPESLAFENV